MKFFALFFAFLALTSVSAVNFLPDYCGKPCNDPVGMICAYNQQCFNVFINKCAMKKRNCDFDDRFMEAQMISCLMAQNKCRF